MSLPKINVDGLKSFIPEAKIIDLLGPVKKPSAN